MLQILFFSKKWIFIKCDFRNIFFFFFCQPVFIFPFCNPAEQKSIQGNTCLNLNGVLKILSP